MTAIRVVILCLSAAMICATLRVERPEIATAVSLCAGLMALMLTGDALKTVASGLGRFAALAAFDSEVSAAVLKAAGIAVISELAGQVCADAGERALEGRIRLASRIVMLGMAMPIVSNVVDSVQSLFC